MDIFTEGCKVVNDSKIFVKAETFLEIDRYRNSIVVPSNLYYFGLCEIHLFEIVFFIEVFISILSLESLSL